MLGVCPIASKSKKNKIKKIKKILNKAVGGTAGRKKKYSGDKTIRRGVFIRDSVPVIGCEVGIRRTNGQI